jgi:hypothetical protein
MIRPPFANYPYLTLQRLVMEGFEEIERNAAAEWDAGNWGSHGNVPMNLFDFQTLMAAMYYLQTTKDDTPS